MMQHGIHNTIDTQSALCMDHCECHSGAFNVIHCHHSKSKKGLARCSYDYLTSHYHGHYPCHNRWHYAAACMQHLSSRLDHMCKKFCCGPL